jgi:L-asparaginase II
MSDMRALPVETTRGAYVENLSEVRAAVVDATGRVIEAYGEPAEFPVRSTIKLLQAIPLVASGAADAFSVSDAELALACSSHGGEDRHAALVERWLGRLGLGEHDLRCGPALPMTDQVRERYLASGGRRTRLRHNCSGKHAGFLTVGAQLGAAPDDYLRTGGVVQQAALEVIAQRCDVIVDGIDLPHDGCGAPAVAMPLASLARGMASTLAAAPASPEQRLLSAIAGNPFLVAGTGSFDTALIDRTGGRVLAKIGADGMHIALDRENGLAVAVKSISGTPLPAQVALVELLRRLGSVTEDECAEMSRPAVLDDAGRQVGEVRIAESPLRR